LTASRLRAASDPKLDSAVLGILVLAVQLQLKHARRLVPVPTHRGQKAAIRWITQNAATVPMAYGGTHQAHAGDGTGVRRRAWRASAMTPKTEAAG
jgi:hypothetical protein